jgi:cytochrome P450
LGPRQCPGREVAWIEARLFITKILWSFDVEMVPGQNLDYEKDFISYVMWIKPEMRVRFVPVRK